MNWLFDKNIVLTGASSGIGKELTIKLIKKYHCKIIGISRTEQNLINLKNDLNEFSDYFDYYAMDVCLSQNWHNLNEHLLEINFQPDILINNAGIMMPFSSFSNINENDIDKVFKTNFFSAIYSIKALMPLLQKSSNPAIINISSAAALCCMPGTSIYSASKSALETFSEILHCELRKKVYVCTIMPGFTKTNLFKNKEFGNEIINCQDKKIVDRFSMSVDKMSNKIIKNIKHKKARAIIGFDAKMLNILYKLMPQNSGNLVGKILNRNWIHLKIFGIK